jgi:hypothetical protein
MGYTITFYAIDGQVFARQLQESSEDLLEKIEQSLRDQPPEDDSARQVLLDAACRICRDDIPVDGGLEYFYALCWLAEVASERVTVCSFQGFRRLSFLDAIGFWPWLLRHPAPFPVPHSVDSCPAVGFFPVADMEAFLPLPESPRLPPSEDRDVLNARDEFCDVLETLIRDRLDMLAVLLYDGP